MTIEKSFPELPLSWEYSNSKYHYVRDSSGIYFRKDAANEGAYSRVTNIALRELLDERYRMEKKHD